MNSDEPMVKIAEDLGVHIKTLYAWIRTYKNEHNIPIGHSRVSNKGTSKESLNEENARLRKENRLLKQERDILKKATAYFAKETL
jgi:transposase